MVLLVFFPVRGFRVSVLLVDSPNPRVTSTSYNVLLSPHRSSAPIALVSPWDGGPLGPVLVLAYVGGPLGPILVLVVVRLGIPSFQVQRDWRCFTGIPSSWITFKL